MRIPTITDGELQILSLLWEESPQPAARIAKRLLEEDGWNKNTTYTFLKRLVDKGAVERTDPGFLCRPLLTRQQVGVSQGRQFLNKVFGGSLSLMVQSFAQEERLSDAEWQELRRLIDESGEEEGHD